MGFGLDDQGIGIRLPVRARYFSLLHDVLTGFGPCPVGSGSPFPRDETTMVWNSYFESGKGGIG
jgi:hypothetical protein